MEHLLELRLVGLVIATIYGAYRLFVWAITRVGTLPGVGNVVSAESTKGTDRFRLSLGKLFNWNVTVNPDKGTVGGSIQVGAPQGWLVVGVGVALVAAWLVPKVSGLLLAAALVAVAVGFHRRALSDRGRRDP